MPRPVHHKLCCLKDTSIKTRIETIWWVRGLFSATSVWKILPLKQGLKHWFLAVIFLNHNPVWKILPLKQGLKLLLYSSLMRCHIVWKILPLKQGLKLTYKGVSNGYIWVWKILPLKQGLKLQEDSLL